MVTFWLFTTQEFQTNSTRPGHILATYDARVVVLAQTLEEARVAAVDVADAGAIGRRGHPEFFADVGDILKERAGFFTNSARSVHTESKEITVFSKFI